MAVIAGTGGGTGPTGDIRQLVAGLIQQKQYVPPVYRQALSQQGIIGQTSGVGRAIGKAASFTGIPQYAQGAIWSITHPRQRLTSGTSMEVPWVAGRPWFHGSSHVFETPDPARSASSSLYGPGHYVTDDPAIASTYAPKGGGGAPNVTRYGFEPDEIFDVRAPITQDVTGRIVKALQSLSKQEPRPQSGMIPRENVRRADASAAIRELAGNRANALNAIWNELEAQIGAAQANRVLREAGFDAISYPGGAMTGGKAHNALVVLNQDVLRRGGAANPRYAGTPRPTG